MEYGVCYSEHLVLTVYEQVAIANGASTPKPSEAALRAREKASRTRASKEHYCALCDKAFDVAARLKRHLASKKHIAKAKLAA